MSYKPYQLPYSERTVVRDMIIELLDNNISQESNFAYGSPIVLVKKKNGEYRLCVDYRALNKKTVKDSYLMPVIDDHLSSKVYFTSLKFGYYQIPMAEGSRHLTAFVTPDGHYEYTRMPFGLVNAPAVFQHMVNKALGKDRYAMLRVSLAFCKDVNILRNFARPSSIVEAGDKRSSIYGIARSIPKFIN